MATAAQITEVRLNVNDNTAPYAYTDEYIGGLVDSEGGTSCASAVIWRLVLGNIAQAARTGLKSASAGAESHTYHGVSEQLAVARQMYALYVDLCKEDKGYGTGYMPPITFTSVAGIIDEDTLDELSGY